MDRRNFCKNMALGGLLGPLAGYCLAEDNEARSAITGFGELVSDPRKILDLPRGFSYQVISVFRQKMSDGLAVPGWPDGMHAFAMGRDRVAILCNHELEVFQHKLTGWHEKRPVSEPEKNLIYDFMFDAPAPGGVRRMVYHLRKGELETQYMVLSGTLRNCSGGPTPWNSWISCEESVLSAGQAGLQQDHGYCFEIPANAKGLVDAVPLKAMGRFNHEAAAVDPATGIVYLTEDRGDGLLYRYIPNQSGKLANGGKLQALALVELNQSISTGNRGRVRFPQQKNIPVRWVDVDDVDSVQDNLRYQGASKGAATFVRGEGMLVESAHEKNGPTTIWIMCTEGGRKGLGQLFHYRPSPHEGRAKENDNPGMLSLFSEPNNSRLLKNGDNIAAMPNGDILICEDCQGIQRLIGVNRNGGYYVLAANPRGASEFTGATFSPDGSVLFVNLQQQGGTLAIRGPWKKPSLI